MVLPILVNVLLPVFVVAGISAIAQRQLRLDVQSFSKAAFYVFSPAMVIDALANSDVSGAEFGQLALAYVLTILVLWGLGEIASRLLRLEAGTRAAFLAPILLPNTGNYGLPVNLLAFGPAGLARAALVVTVNSLVRSTLGVFIAARGQAASPRESLKRVLSVPVLYAALIGLVVNVTGLRLPEPILKAANVMGQGLVPASLLVLGAQVLWSLEARRRPAKTGPLAIATMGRLVVAPLLAFAIGDLVGLEGLTQKVLTLESATPAAVMSLVLATEFDTDVPFAALAVLVTTLVSLVTVTAWLVWLM
ncbi:MAG: AEC family transporter [Anaerolineae bacterium]|nr:AEC family transporter [Anaerolineae bacterium]